MAGTKINYRSGGTRIFSRAFGGAGFALLISSCGGKVPVGVLDLLGPELLVDTSQQVTDSNWLFLPFRLDRPADVEFEFEVTQGKDVTAYIVDATQWEKASRDKDFVQYEPLGATRKTSHRARSQLGAGNYGVLIREGSPPNILGAPDIAIVHVKVSAYRGGGR